MTSRINRIDLHTETVPGGGQACVPHSVQAVPHASQNLLKVCGLWVLREGDGFSCGHVPQVGAFSKPLLGGTGEGRLSKAGQNIVHIIGIPCATMAGKNQSCSDGIEEMLNISSVSRTPGAVATIGGQQVLLST